jgi:hypothetical protein
VGAGVIAEVSQHPIVVGVVVPVILGLLLGVARGVVGIVRMERSIPARLDQIDTTLARQDARTDRLDDDLRAHMTSEDAARQVERAAREERQKALDSRLSHIDDQLAAGAERMTRIEAKLGL